MSHFKQLKDKKGFTLVEVVIALAITGILVTSGVSFITPFIKLFFYAPEQLRTEYIGNQIVDSVIEGNHGIEGLDTAKMINFASQEVIIYTNNNDEVILLEWDPATGKIRRTLPSGQVQFLPIDTPNHQIKIAGSVTPEVIFKYFNSFNNPVPTPINDPWLLSRVELDWVTYTGTNNKHQTNYQILTGVHIKKNSD